MRFTGKQMYKEYADQIREHCKKTGQQWYLRYIRVWDKLEAHVREAWDWMANHANDKAGV